MKYVSSFNKHGLVINRIPAFSQFHQFYDMIGNLIIFIYLNPRKWCWEIWLSFGEVPPYASVFSSGKMSYNQISWNLKAIRQVFEAVWSLWNLAAIWWFYHPISWIPDTQNCGLRMRRECREHYPHHRLQRKPLVSNPSMHHGSCVTHVPWCMSASLTGSSGEHVPSIPDVCATHKMTMMCIIISWVAAC